MTRINLVPVDDLEVPFLKGEYKEIVRIFNLVRKAQLKGKYPKDIKAPAKFKLGEGHVKFFYDKLTFIEKRYYALARKMKEYGFNANPVQREELLDGLDKVWFNDYSPSKEDIRLSNERLNERRKELGMIDNV